MRRTRRPSLTPARAKERLRVTSHARRRMASRADEGGHADETNSEVMRSLPPSVSSSPLRRSRVTLIEWRRRLRRAPRGGSWHRAGSAARQLVTGPGSHVEGTGGGGVCGGRWPMPPAADVRTSIVRNVSASPPGFLSAWRLHVWYLWRVTKGSQATCHSGRACHVSPREVRPRVTKGGMQGSAPRAIFHVLRVGDVPAP